MTAPERATFDKSQQQYRGLLGKIQVGRQQLNMEEDDYRQIVLEETGRLSLKGCSIEKLEKVLARLKAKGFTPLPKGGAKSAAMHPMARKARAMWISLYQLGAVHNPSEKALEAFAKRQLGCERLVWARQGDAYKLIEALKAMAERAGWKQTHPDTGKPLSLRTLKFHLCEVILGKLKDAGAVPRDWDINTAAFRLCGIELGSDGPCTGETYTRLAKHFGDKLRELAPQETAA